MSDFVLVKSYKTSEARRRANAKWKANNYEKQLQLQREWNKKNKDKHRASLKKSRDRARLLKQGFKELAAICVF
jgi:hypothetical protein